MNARQRLWLGLAGLALLAALGVFLAQTLHPGWRDVDLGPAPQARSDAWLAAERFLAGRGLTVSRDLSL